MASSNSNNLWEEHCEVKTSTTIYQIDAVTRKHWRVALWGRFRSTVEGSWRKKLTLVKITKKSLRDGNLWNGERLSFTFIDCPLVHWINRYEANQQKTFSASKRPLMLSAQVSRIIMRKKYFLVRNFHVIQKKRNVDTIRLKNVLVSWIFEL